MLKPAGVRGTVLGHYAGVPAARWPRPASGDLVEGSSQHVGSGCSRPRRHRGAGAATVAVLVAPALAAPRHLRDRRCARRAARRHWLQVRTAAAAERNCPPSAGGSEPIEEPELFVGPTGLTGVVLVNIGTPASTDVEDVRNYLLRFLGDKPVIDIEDPEDKRAVLEQLLRSRPAKSAEGYRRIWDPVRGSPLLYHTEDLAAGLQEALGEAYDVCIGFQYSEPSMESALMRLTSLGAEKIVLVPMFPHFAEATVGAFLANASKTAARLGCAAYLQVVPPFYNSPAYIEPAHQRIGESVGPGGRGVDHVVFSFHGIPESQCMRTDETESLCMRVPDCCSRRCDANRNCYRAQCLETARLLARSLGLPDGHWSAAFQSRRAVRGSIRWTKPYTDELLAELPSQGFRRVAVCAPSYTVDCIETLGELGHDGRELFKAAGGTELVVIPCLNASETWTRGLAQLVRQLLVEGRAGGYWAM